MSLALVGIAGADEETGWSNGDVPAEHAIRGFHGVTLLIEDAAPNRRDPDRRVRLRASPDRKARSSASARRQAREGGDRRHPRGGGLSARPAGPRLGASHCLPRGGRRASRRRWCAKLRENHGHASDGAEGPQLFPLGLFPRAGRHPVRDRDRRARLRRRRTGRPLGAGAEAAGIPRAAPQRRSRPRFRRSSWKGPRDERESVLHPSLRAGAPGSTRLRCCCCTAPAATRTICCRSAS